MEIGDYVTYIGTHHRSTLGDRLLVIIWIDVYTGLPICRLEGADRGCLLNWNELEEF